MYTHMYIHIYTYTYMGACWMGCDRWGPSSVPLTCLNRCDLLIRAGDTSCQSCISKGI